VRGNQPVFGAAGARGEAADEAPALPPAFHAAQNWPASAWSLGVVGLCNGVGWLLAPYLSPPNLVMIYLLGVVFVAARFGRWPSLVNAFLSVIAFNFFFVPPRSPST
jgi:two-component system sensor histidine kinase KdpD